MIFFRRMVGALWPFDRGQVEIIARVREALTSPIPNEHGIVISAVGKRCVRCGASLTDIAWYYSGWTPDPDDVTGSGFIYLCFPNCARVFRDALDRDLAPGESGDPGATT